jgi:signal transduction histidine kinase
MPAQGERGLDAREPVRLDELVGEVVEQHRARAAATRGTLQLDTRPLTVAGDAVLLTQLTANLVHDAIRYNHPGGGPYIAVRPYALTPAPTA